MIYVEHISKFVCFPGYNLINMKVDQLLLLIFVKISLFLKNKVFKLFKTEISNKNYYIFKSKESVLIST